MDRLTTQQRHKNMASIRSTNTKPEILVRKYLWSQGFRYRLNNPRLPGHPDIVLRKYRTCVFVNGCFWHGHEGCSLYRLPQTHTDYWRQKILRNQERDHENRLALKAQGWHTIEVWECQLKKTEREQTLKGLLRTLNYIALQNRGAKINYHYDDEENLSIAAEQE